MVFVSCAKKICDLREKLHQRIFQKTVWTDEKVDDLYEQLLGRNTQNQECLCRLDEYCSETFGYTLSRQEKFYLLIHLTKIL